MGLSSGDWEAGPCYLAAIQAVILPRLQAWVHPADAIRLPKGTVRRSERTLRSRAAKFAAFTHPQQPFTRWVTHSLMHLDAHCHAC